jgi:hypothetical protein
MGDFEVRRQSAGVPSGAAPLGWQRCGAGALDLAQDARNPKRCRAALATALHKILDGSTGCKT